jgi:hypothetical protein
LMPVSPTMTPMPVIPTVTLTPVYPTKDIKPPHHEPAPTATPTPVIPTVTLTPVYPTKDIKPPHREPRPTATPTPWMPPPGFLADIYPLPLPVAEGVVWWVGQGCPNPTGLEKADHLPLEAVLEVLTGLGSGDLDIMRRVSDPAFWPLLEPGGWRQEPWPRDWVEVPQPASASPHAEFIANACGEEILERSWWVKLCPGPCQDPNVARAASLTGHFYLIKRKGHWLVWAVE